MVGGAISQATPDIEAAAIGNVVQASESALAAKLDGAVAHMEAHMTKRTGFVASIGTNLVAWIVSLAITIVILVMANRGGVEQAAVGGANRLIDGRSGQAGGGAAR